MSSLSPIPSSITNPKKWPHLGNRRAEAPVDDVFVQRWSRRAFTDQAIPPEFIKTLFEAARWAPSACEFAAVAIHLQRR